MQQYTFILTASKELPKQCIRYGTAAAKFASRKNVGVRMPDDAICRAILERMDAPLISTRLVTFVHLIILIGVVIWLETKCIFNFSFIIDSNNCIHFSFINH